MINKDPAYINKLIKNEMFVNGDLIDIQNRYDTMKANTNVDYIIKPFVVFGRTPWDKMLENFCNSEQLENMSETELAANCVGVLIKVGTIITLVNMINVKLAELWKKDQGRNATKCPGIEDEIISDELEVQVLMGDCELEIQMRSNTGNKVTVWILIRNYLDIILRKPYMADTAYVIGIEEADRKGTHIQVTNFKGFPETLKNIMIKSRKIWDILGV